MKETHVLKIEIGYGLGKGDDAFATGAQAARQALIRPFFSVQEDNSSTVWQELTRQGKAAFALLFSPGNTRHADSRSYEILEELKRLSGGRWPDLGGIRTRGGCDVLFTLLERR
ncbi:MAG: hypothetical protein PVF45_14345 [Anaerolineae bacterium]